MERRREQFERCFFVRPKEPLQALCRNYIRRNTEHGLCPRFMYSYPQVVCMGIICILSTPTLCTSNPTSLLSPPSPPLTSHFHPYSIPLHPFSPHPHFCSSSHLPTSPNVPLSQPMFAPFSKSSPMYISAYIKVSVLNQHSLSLILEDRGGVRRKTTFVILFCLTKVFLLGATTR